METSYSNKFKVVFAIATLNDTYLYETIDSIQEIKFPSSIAIVISYDGGDKSLAKKVRRKYKDPKYPIFFTEYSDRKGVGFAKNKAVTKAIKLSNQYIQLIDGDDIYNLDSMQGQIDAIETQKADIVFSDGIMFGDRQGHIRVRTHDYIMSSNPFTSWAFGTKEIFTRYNFHQQAKHFDDWNLWRRMIDGKVKYALYHRPVVLYRVHEKSLTHDPTPPSEKLLHFYL